MSQSENAASELDATASDLCRADMPARLLAGQGERNTIAPEAVPDVVGTPWHRSRDNFRLPLD